MKRWSVFKLIKKNTLKFCRNYCNIIYQILSYYTIRPITKMKLNEKIL